MLELLAPAGDIKSFEAAINAGADAVYLGLNNFNARLKAENFNQSNIREYIKKAHLLGVKVYITVNTIVKNEEFDELIDLVRSAVNARADAFLVQDLGVVKVLTSKFPGIVLHASTQMGIHNLYGAKICEKLGIRRVVLSRETKLEDIKQIKQNTSLEIEYFVQGALCIAFSGNCYMSSIENNASGNRGLCKQLCRLPYTANINGEKKEGYLLSAKDLSLANNLTDLIEAGVTSFKIEGRMRRPGYVATVVSIYRKLLDRISSTGKARLDKEDELSLKKAFSRGEYLSRAYLDEGTPFVVEEKYANHIGIEIGKVTSVKKFKDDLFKVEIYSKVPLHNGDGLKLFLGNLEKGSLGVGDCKKVKDNIYSFITKAIVKEGYQVNLILDFEREEELLDYKKKLAITIDVVAMCNNKLKIKAQYNNISVTKESAENLEPAKNAPLSEEDIKGQISKCGDTCFVVDNCFVITDGVFAAKSVMNALRRDVLLELENHIISQNETINIIEKDFDFDYSIDNSIIDAQIINEDTSFIKQSDLYVVSLSVFSIQSLNRILQILPKDMDKIALKLPIISNSNDLKIIETIIKDSGIKNLLSENMYGLYFIDKGYTVLAGAGHNVSNKYATLLLNELGCKGVSKSIEFKDFEDSALKEIKIENELPIMTFAHCPFKTLYKNSCDKCSYKNGLQIIRNSNKYRVRRVKISQCYFELYK